MINKNFSHLRFFLIILIGLFSGCWFIQRNSPCDSANPAELLRSGVYGTRTLQESSATWIMDHMQFKEVHSALNKHAVDKDSMYSDMDFETYGVLFIEMGQRPTGGYAIDFEPSLSSVIGGRAVIHVYWKAPADGAIVTQAVTSPFMLLKIRRADITSIVVLDQENRILFELPIKS